MPFFAFSPVFSAFFIQLSRSDVVSDFDLLILEFCRFWKSLQTWGSYKPGYFLIPQGFTLFRTCTSTFRLCAAKSKLRRIRTSGSESTYVVHRYIGVWLRRSTDISARLIFQ